MFKTFKLIGKKEEQFSATKGKMTFHLEDESGIERSVWGHTQLDQDLNSVSITALKPREHPLIQCLFLTNVNETINIEFTQYNDVFERKDEVDQVVTAEDIKNIAKEMQSKPLRVGALLQSTEVKNLR